MGMVWAVLRRWGFINLIQGKLPGPVRFVGRSEGWKKRRDSRLMAVGVMRAGTKGSVLGSVISARRSDRGGDGVLT